MADELTGNGQKLAIQPRIEDLAVWGDRKEIREMALRFKTMLPNCKDLTDVQALSFAQAVFITKLNPFNSELMPLGGGDKPWLGPYIGISGRRRRAHEQIEKFRSSYSIKQFEVGDNEKLSLGYEKAWIVYKTILRDGMTLSTWIDGVNALQRAGFSKEEIKNELGDSPTFIGYGIVKPNENTIRPKHDIAKKRSERAALVLRFDVPLEFPEVDDSDMPDPIDEDAQPDSQEWKMEGSEIVEHDEVKEEYTAATFYADAKAWGFDKKQADEFMNEAGALPDVAKSLAEKKFHANRLAKNKKQLGRDDTGIN